LLKLQAYLRRNTRETWRHSKRDGNESSALLLPQSCIPAHARFLELRDIDFAAEPPSLFTFTTLSPRNWFAQR